MSGLLRKSIIAAQIVVTLGVAVISWHDAALQYWRRQVLQGIASANDVPSYVAGDPQIRIDLALVRLQNGTVGRGEAAALASAARAVLRDDPIDPEALYALGMASELVHPGAGLGLLLLSERQSRRLVYTELALESALAGRGDLAGAVARIDDLVTVSPDLAAPIFASIAPALPDPSLQAAFAVYAGRPWFGYLAKSAVENGVDTATVLALLHSGRHSITPVMKAAIYADLIRRVVNDGDFDAARRLVGELAPGERRTIGQIGFSRESIDPQLSVLGWSLFNDATTSAALGSAGTLEVMVGPDQSQAVATRTTLLPPGRYVLTQTVGHDTASPRAGVTWEMSCAISPGIAAWHQPIPDRGGASETYQVPVTIPSGCNAQNWRLIALGATGQTSSTVTVGGLRLQPQGLGS